MKKCPFCAEEIQDEAILCRYCKSDLGPSSNKHTTETPQIHFPHPTKGFSNNTETPKPYVVNKPSKNKKITVIMLIVILLGLGIILAEYMNRDYVHIPLTSSYEHSSIQENRLITRHELQVAILRKNKNEVLAILGPPDNTQQSGYYSFWYYKNKSIDPITNKIDQQIQVCFTNGVVDDITF